MATALAASPSPLSPANRPSKAVLYVELPTSDLDAIKAVAALEERSVAAVVRRALRPLIEARRRQG